MQEQTILTSEKVEPDNLVNIVFYISQNAFHHHVDSAVGNVD